MAETSNLAPEASAAEAQTCGHADRPVDSILPEALCGVVGQDFTIGRSLTRAADTRAYERKPGDPIYRPLRIFSLDPSVSKLEGAEAVVKTPFEELEPGPVGGVFEVDDYDESQATHWGRVDLDGRDVLLNSGRDPSTADPLFHQQMVYAVCSTVHAAFSAALGRQPSWGFQRQSRPGRPDRLRIRPHAFEQPNAYYDPQHGELAFGYFRAPDTVAGRSMPGGVVFTCLSHDIIAHEVTHALLDGLRAHFAEPTGPDVLGFHEGFADLVAIFQHFAHPEVVKAAIRNSKGGEVEATALIAGLAHEFSASLGSTKPLRTAFEAQADREQKIYRPGLAPHDLGEILVQTVFEAALTIFKRKTTPYIRLATGGTGVLPHGQLPADLQMLLAREASKTASHFLSICIRAIDYCPPADLDMGEYLRALITADHDLVQDDQWGYREALIDAFRRRRIYPPHVGSLSEESLRWESAELLAPVIPSLNFANLKFQGDPATPASAEELRRQAVALGAVLGSSHNLSKFGLARQDDPGLRRDQLSLPKIQSIRSARRAGPNGQIIFDLVAEVTQRRTVSDPRGSFNFYGGATVIIGPTGEVRYVISKNILNTARLERQRAFIHGAGKRFWQTEDGKMKPVQNAFRLLHGRSDPDA